jgi:peptidoglycan/LPS O-acetylase OafA/YrhL
MQSQNVTYMPRLDHLRLLAALLVLCFHYFHFYRGGWVAYPDQPWFALVTEGHTGVSLFFVLSGFIFMTIAAGRNAIAYRQFLRNRLLRIAPLFLVIFFIALSINRDSFQPADIFYILFTNIGSPPTSAHFATGPAWSISVEFTFYFIFPFLAFFVARHGSGYLLRVLMILAFVKLAAHFATANSTHMFYSTLIGRMDQFVIGMLAALWLKSRADWFTKNGTYLLVGATIFLFVALMVQARYASYFLPEPKQAFWIYWSAVEASGWALFTLGYLSTATRIPKRIDAALATMGQWSFSIYMWHAVVIFTAHSLLVGEGGVGATGFVLQFLLVLAFTLAFAWLSFTTIEQPFLKLRGSYVKDGAQANAGPMRKAQF